MTTPLRIYLAAGFANQANALAWRQSIASAGAATTEGWPDITPPDTSQGITDALRAGAKALALSEGEKAQQSHVLFLCDSDIDAVQMAQYAIGWQLPVVWAAPMALGAFQAGVFLVESGNVNDAIALIPWLVTQAVDLSVLGSARQNILSKF